ncbi:HAD family phosphatase [Aquabacterium sp.]|uniref:HAD family hydrolase n=1 Tax=Aquabacterium sp. TaxID=1872578 RepID=UPI0025C6EA5A|nr:HAD family phosphatase [Aquabacterium sp.]
MSAVTAAAPAPAGEPTEAVLFDFGGVLFNWQPVVLLQQVLPEHARSDEEALALASTVFQSFLPGSDWAEFDRGVASLAEVRDRIAARTGLPAEGVHRLIEAIPHHLAPLADSVAWLERLVAAGTRLHFLSNMPVPYKAHLLREHAFLGHFRSGVFSCDVKQIKPNADIFQTTAEALGLNPARTLFIDDNPHNIQTAREQGWRAVRFVNAAQAEAEARQLGWL